MFPFFLLMNRIVQIAKDSQTYMDRFEANVVTIVESKPISDFIIDINRDQFAKHQDANGNPLIHKSTGKPTLTKYYAKKTGKSKPDFLVTGEFQDKMFLKMPSIEEYVPGSKDYKSLFLSKNYGKIFGVAPANQKKSQQKVDSAIIGDFKNKVFK